MRVTNSKLGGQKLSRWALIVVVEQILISVKAAMGKCSFNGGFVLQIGQPKHARRTAALTQVARPAPQPQPPAYDFIVRGRPAAAAVNSASTNILRPSTLERVITSVGVT